jgi:hypothetical protein
LAKAAGPSCATHGTSEIGQGYDAAVIHRLLTATCPGAGFEAHSVRMVFPFTSLRPMPPTRTKSSAINQHHDSTQGSPYPTGVIQDAG